MRITRITLLALSALSSLLALASPWAAAAAQSTLQQPKEAAIPTPVPSPILPIVPTVARGYEAPRVAPSAAPIIGVTQQPFVGVALQDAVAMALLKNPDLAFSASDVKIARYQIVQAKGPFDVQFRVEPSSSYSVQPPQNPLFAGPNYGNIVQHQSSLQYGFQGQTINGTQFGVGIQQARIYNNTTVNQFNPYYAASLNVSVTQPLLRNLGMNESKRELKLAVVNQDSQTAQALVDSSNIIWQVEDAYWDLVSAWRNVAIQEAALKEAIAQQKSNVRLAKRGRAAPINAIESSTQVSTFQTQVFSAIQQVSEIQNKLKSLIVTDPGDPIWTANLVPTTSVLQLPSVADLDTIVAVAHTERPEVRQARDREAKAAIDRAYARNQSLPQADISAQYQSNGFAGTIQAVPPVLASLCPGGVCPTPPPATQGTMAQAYHNLWGNLYPTFNINFTVSFPLQNDYANGLKGQASEEERQAQIVSEQVAQRIGFESRNALMSYQSALSQLNSARQARESAEQVLASEQRKFDNGESTTYLVLQRQVQLNQAQGIELSAQNDLNKSIVELQRVEGTILSNNGVNLQTLGTRALATPNPQGEPSADR